MVTKDGGHTAKESQDGKWLYYTSSDNYEIRRMTIGSENDSLIVKTKIIIATASWALVEDGIIYKDTRTKNNQETIVIEFLNFRTGKVSTIADEMSNSLHISISPDEKWLLHTQYGPGGGSDIYLVENFR